MRVFRCPVCGQRISIFQKYWRSIWGGISCSYCCTQLQIKKYGSGRADATLAVVFVYFCLGVKDWIFPAAIMAFIVVDFIKRIFSPIILFDQNQKASCVLWTFVFIMAMGLLAALLFSIAAK